MQVNSTIVTWTTRLYLLVLVQNLITTISSTNMSDVISWQINEIQIKANIIQFSVAHSLMHTFKLRSFEHATT